MVITKAGEAFETWRTADAVARAAEKRLQQAWTDYSVGIAAPPGKELIHEVTQLRAHAHQKLTAAIAVIGSEIHDRRPAPPASGNERPSSR